MWENYEWFWLKKNAEGMLDRKNVIRERLPITVYVITCIFSRCPTQVFLFNNFLPTCVGWWRRFMTSAWPAVTRRQPEFSIPFNITWELMNSTGNKQTIKYNETEYYFGALFGLGLRHDWMRTLQQNVWSISDIDLWHRNVREVKRRHPYQRAYVF